jgi:hypothetical protein
MADIQFWPAVGVGNNGTPGTIVQWSSLAYPSGASPAALTVAGVVATSFLGAGSPSRITSAHAVFQWTSTQNLGLVNSGLQLVVGQIFRLPVDTDEMELIFRVMTTETDRIGEYRWEVHSVSTPSDSFDGTFSLMDGVWNDVSIGPLDFSGWAATTEIVVTLNVKGTTNPANVGATDLLVEYFLVRAV